MKDSIDLFIGMNINQKLKQKHKIQQMIKIVEDFLLMLLFKELIDCLFLLLTILMVMPIKLNFFLQRVDITMYNVLIDCRNIYDKPIRDDYTTECLLDCQYFKNHYK